MLPVFGVCVGTLWAATRDPLPPDALLPLRPTRNGVAIGADQIAPAPETGWLLPCER